MIPLFWSCNCISNEIKRIPSTNYKERLAVYKNGGSHYIYEKNEKREPVPYHGAKGMGDGLRKKLIKKMRLN